MRLVSQLIFLYDLILDAAIIHILRPLNLYQLFRLKVLHFSSGKARIGAEINFFFNISNASFAFFVHTNGPVFFFSRITYFTA